VTKTKYVEAGLK